VTRGKRRAVDWDLDMSSEQHPSLLGAAMALSHNKLFNLLLRRGASPDSRTEDTRTCLSVATDRGDVTTIKNLIAAGATIYDGHSEPNAVHPHAMHTAVVRSEPEIVKNCCLTLSTPPGGILAIQKQYNLQVSDPTRSYSGPF
jgi:ankyrin repeat protein